MLEEHEWFCVQYKHGKYKCIGYFTENELLTRPDKSDTIHKIEDSKRIRT